MTNGGGVTEQQKADELSSWFGIQVRENQAGALYDNPLCKCLSEYALEKVWKVLLFQITECMHELECQVLPIQELPCPVLLLIPALEGLMCICRR